MLKLSVIEAFVYCNAVEPAEKSERRLVGVEVFIRFYENRLGEIFCIFVIMDHSIHQVENCLLMLVDNLFKCALITVKNSRNQAFTAWFVHNYKRMTDKLVFFLPLVTLF